MATQKEQIGIYGGVFDPIHFGHLNLALELMEKCGLAEVWFCPAHGSPHKQTQPSTAAPERLEMVRLAIEGIPSFRVIDRELRRPAPSYTIDTIRELHQQIDGKRELRLLLGNDHIARFGEWKEVEALVELAPPLVGRRTLHPEPFAATGKHWIDEILKKNFIETSLMEISSSAIRQRLRAGQYCGHLVPAKTLEYIHKHKLTF